MYPVSEAYKAAIMTSAVHHIRGSVRLTNGTSITVTDELIGDICRSMQCLNDSSVFGIGGVYQGQLIFSLVADSIERNSLYGAEVNFDFGLEISADNTEWVPLGVLYIAKAVRNENQINCTAYDRMSELDTDMLEASMKYNYAAGLVPYQAATVYSLTAIECDTSTGSLETDGKTIAEADFKCNGTSTDCFFSADVEISAQTAETLTNFYSENERIFNIEISSFSGIDWIIKNLNFLNFYHVNSKGRFIHISYSASGLKDLIYNCKFSGCINYAASSKFIYSSSGGVNFRILGCSFNIEGKCGTDFDFILGTNNSKPLTANNFVKCQSVQFKLNLTQGSGSICKATVLKECLLEGKINITSEQTEVAMVVGDTSSDKVDIGGNNVCLLNINKPIWYCQKGDNILVYDNTQSTFTENSVNAVGCTDIQRAAMFYVQIKISYGADGRTYGCNKKNIAADYLTKIEERLKAGSGVVIEHKDFENLIKVYDRSGALFYCDPPYHKTEKYYDAEFKQSDHERLNLCLNSIKGRFILSYNDDEYIRELYKNFNIIAVERQNNLSSGSFKEIIITNF